MFPNESLTTGVMPEDAIFALDIGTRTVIGLVGVQKDERFIVHAVEIIEHQSRAMLDGQIHDIQKVAQGVKKVKEALEKKLGYTLTKVSIAAAGRVLKTCRVKVERDIDEGREIDAQLVGAIEMEGIQKAQLEIDRTVSNNEKNQFYCVGYSVVGYYLNDYVISSLTGHKGSRAGVEILATFLPHMVVDSLYTVMERTGLEVTHLTLEPIAALNVAIPNDLRLLNLALVDIGAGTSDIAITKAGTVIAYAMVPVAGDELTEAIAQHYLVDFNMAEKIKLSMSNEETITFTDILDNQVTVTAEEVGEVIRPVVDQLAHTITERIYEYNGGKAPNAVFLVGGGSQVRGLSEAISQCIGLPRERVAVRNRSIAKNVVLEEDILNGPESITPLGILVTTGMTRGRDFFYVTVNGAKVRMYNSRKMSVSDALILAGFNPEQLICKSGRNLKFILNGKDKTVRGSFGQPAVIYVNNAVSSLSTVVSPGDDLKVMPAEKGKDATARISDFIEENQAIELRFNGQTYRILPKAFKNGEEADPGLLISEGDKIDISDRYSLSEIVSLYEIDPLLWDLCVNGGIAEPDCLLKAGDIVECRLKAYGKASEQESGREPANNREPEHSQEPKNSREPQGEPEPGSAASSGIQAVIEEASHKAAEKEGITVTVNGKPVKMPPKASGHMFIDVFNYIDFDLTTPKGVIILKLNGRDANYVDVIKTGDNIDIYWRE